MDNRHIMKQDNKTISFKTHLYSGGVIMLIIDGNSIYEVDMECLKQKHLDFGTIYGNHLDDSTKIQKDFVYNGKIIRKDRYTGKGIGVAILDTGLYPHPDFKSRILCFQDMIHKKNTPYDTNGHGTHEAVT